jgi:hypothetical protein
VADGVPVLVGDRETPGGAGVTGGGGDQVAGLPRVDRAQRACLSGPVGQAERGDQRDGQVDAPAETPAAAPMRQG